MVSKAPSNEFLRSDKEILTAENHQELFEVGILKLKIPDDSLGDTGNDDHKNDSSTVVDFYLAVIWFRIYFSRH